MVKFPQDIFNLNYEKIQGLDGWGELSISNLKNSINKSKKISLDRFIYSLGIRHIGQENAKLLSQHLKSSANFFKLAKNKNMSELLNIDGIGETQIKSINKFFSTKINLKVLLELKKKISIFQTVIANDSGALSNKTFMFTGKLQGVSRAEAKSLVEQNSGKIISNVSQKLNYLVVGDKPTTKKLNQARNLNINIITQDQLMKMLNKTS